MDNLKTALLLLTLALFTSFFPISNTEEQYHRMMLNLETEFQSRLDSALTSIETHVDTLQQDMDQMYALHPYFNKSTRNRMYDWGRKYGTFPNTNLTYAYNQMRNQLDMDLIVALQDYDGPAFTVTSMKRNAGFGRRFSRHMVGKAVDIRWDRDGRNFIK